MKKLLYTQRKAIAMIELIFAIVIMGLVMLTAPLMVTTAANSSTVSFQQESIAITASHASALMTYAWDEKNTNSYRNSVISNNILTVVSPSSSFAPPIATSGRKRILDTNLSSGNFGSPDPDTDGNLTLSTDEITKDDIDDFHGNRSSLILANTTTTSTSAQSDEDNYIDLAVVLSTDIAYLNTNNINYTTCASTANGCAFSRLLSAGENSASSTNIKKIQVTLTTTNADVNKTILLKAFVCNIGVASPNTRSGI